MTRRFIITTRMVAKQLRGSRLALMNNGYICRVNFYRDVKGAIEKAGL